MPRQSTKRRTPLPAPLTRKEALVSPPLHAQVQRAPLPRLRSQVTHLSPAPTSKEEASSEEESASDGEWTDNEEWAGDGDKKRQERDLAAQRSYNMSSGLKKYHATKAKGVCINCRKVPAEDGHVRCSDGKWVMQIMLHAAKAAGICTRCLKATATSGKTSCEPCLAREKARKAQRLSRNQKELEKALGKRVCANRAKKSMAAYRGISKQKLPPVSHAETRQPDLAAGFLRHVAADALRQYEEGYVAPIKIKYYGPMGGGSVRRAEIKSFGGGGSGAEPIAR
ncbi:uncharacterized protein PG998_004262 [Apiospora kogelbergensis]|uniref:uncharacterized protein n=1 Tax=Apiospora kogelbergensis TaxID=1337665 RepID=UPI003131FFD5